MEFEELRSLYLGSLYRGDLEEAEALLDTLDPSSGELYYLSALQEYQLGNYEGSFELLSSIDQLPSQWTDMLRMQLLYSMDQIEECLKMGQEAEIDDPELKLLRDVVKISAYNRLGDFQQSIAIAHEVESALGDYPAILSRFHTAIGQTHRLQGRYDDAGHHYRLAHRNNQDHGFRLLLAKSANTLGIIYGTQGEHEEALKYFSQYRNLSEELGNIQEMAQANLNVAIVLTNQGRMQESLDRLHEVFDDEDKLADFNRLNYSIAMAHNYSLLGRLSEASVFATQALNLADSTSNSHAKANVLINLGQIHLRKGELTTAWSYLEKAKVMYLQFSNQDRVSEVKNHMATILYQRHRYEEALEILKQVEQIQQQLNLDGALPIIYHQMGRIYFEQQHSDKIMQLVDHLEKLNSSPAVDRVIKVLTGFYHITLDTFEGIVAATPLLTDIIRNPEQVDSEVLLDCIGLLTDIYLKEIRIFGRQQDLGKIISLKDQLMQLGKQQFNYDIICRAHLLDVKLNLLLGEVELAQRHLTDALKLAGIHGLDRMTAILQGEEMRLRSQLNLWQRLVDETTSIQQRLETTDFERLLPMIVRGHVVHDLDREVPYAFVLFNKVSAMPVYYRTYSEVITANQHLLTSFLSAMINFGDEITSEAAPINLMNYGSMSYFFQHDENLVYVYIYGGDSLTIASRMQQTIETINQVDEIAVYRGSFSMMEDLTSEIERTIDIILEHSLLQQFDV